MINSWVILGGLIFFLAAMAGSFYEGTSWEAGKNASDQLAIAQKALQQFQVTADNIAAAANDFKGSQAGLHTAIDAIARNLHNVQAKHPLPPDCKPTVDRLQSVQSAVDAANAAARH